MVHDVLDVVEGEISVDGKGYIIPSSFLIEDKDLLFLLNKYDKSIIREQVRNLVMYFGLYNSINDKIIDLTYVTLTHMYDREVLTPHLSLSYELSYVECVGSEEFDRYKIFNMSITSDEFTEGNEFALVEREMRSIDTFLDESLVGDVFLQFKRIKILEKLSGDYLTT